MRGHFFADVLVVVAADVEWQIVQRVLSIDSPVALGIGQSARVLGWPHAVIVRSGWGKVSAAASTQKAIDIHTPRLVVCIGTCGGIAGRVHLGDLVIVRRAIMHDLRPLMGDIETESRHYTSLADPAFLAYIPGSNAMPQVTIGTGDRDLDEVEAGELADRHGVDALDWESAAIAFVARQNGLPWIIIKGVSDMVVSSDDAAFLYDAYSVGAESVMIRLLKIVEQLLKHEVLPIHWTAKCPS